MKKMLFIFAAAALASLCAKDVDLFELKFYGGKDNFAKSWNYRNALKFEVKPYASAKMALVVTPAKATEKGDTAFNFETPVLNVEGKTVLKLKIESISTHNMQYIAGDCAAAVIWGTGKDAKVEKFKFRSGKTDFVEEKLRFTIPAGVKSAVIRIGFDSPNLNGSDIFVLKELEVEAE